MLKLTAAVAAFALTSVLPTAQASPERTAATDSETVYPETSRRASKPVIEEVAPSTPPARPDRTPIVLTPTDWPRFSSPGDFPTDPSDIAAIPTWPTWYESVHLPAQTNRYAARYGGKALEDAPVGWGPDVVPVIEFLAPAPATSDGTTVRK